MRMIVPTSDEDRIVFLRNSLQAEERQRAASDPYLPARLFTRLQDTYDSFRTNVHDLAELFQARGREIEERNFYATKLNKFVRYFRNGVIDRLALYDFDSSYMRYFRISDIESLPNYLPADQLDEVAGHYIRGDGLARSAGFPRMYDPTAVELENLRSQMQVEMEQASEAKRRMDRSQHTLWEEREEVNALIRIIAQQLDIATDGLPADDVRSIKREYGYEFEEDGVEDEETTSSEADSRSDDSEGDTSPTT